MIYLFTDLDGTFIPEDRDSRIALNSFKKFTYSQYLKIIYVTGRNLQETKSAIKMHKLPDPFAVICDVGTTIYHKKALGFVKDRSYYKHLKSIINKSSTSIVKGTLKGNKELIPQEFSKQRKFKISYYFKRDCLDINFLKVKLEKVQWDYIISYSHDYLGLLDIIPKNISKLSAINWISQKFSDKDYVLFAGDSGNDMKVFESKIYSIVVNNTPEEIKNKLSDRENIYISNKKYTNGVLDGYLNYRKKRGI